MTKIKLKNGHIAKRHFYNGVHYNIDMENKVVELTPEFKLELLNKRLWGKFGYKKIGGSSLGAVLGSNKWGSLFTESLRIMWLGEPMYDPKYVNAGVAIEPKIVDAMRMVSGKDLETFPAEKYNYDYFQGEKVIGGLPDAIDFKVDRRVYEIKTTKESNESKWDNEGVPEYYVQQACLYDYLVFGKNDYTFKNSGVKRYSTIVACFLKEEDYKNPEAVDIRQRTLKTYKVGYTYEDVCSWMEKCREFHQSILLSGKSYKFDETNRNDAAALEFLMCKNEQEFIELLQKRGLV